MGEAFHSVVTFLTDKSHKLSAKALVIIGVFLLMLFIDNTFGFTFFYQNEKKLAQIEQINRILSGKEEVDSATKSYLLKLKDEVVKRESLRDKVVKHLTNLNFNTIYINDNVKQSEIHVSKFWHYVSSSWIFVIMMIAMPFAAIADKKHSLGYNLFILFLVELLLFLFGLGLSKLTSYIPIFFADRIWINYIVNVLCVTVIIALPVFLIGLKEKQNKKKVAVV